jgi:aminoglycoside phosphotransferase (APT) family kinase protein
MDQCDRWQEYEREYTDCYHPDVWGAIRAMVGRLDHRGWLGDHFHLVHGDLYPRNIIVKVKSETEVVVTGIVDWDMAYFAPKFMALSPPNWAWSYGCDDGSDDGGVEREVVAYKTDFKEAFRAAASDEYHMTALSAEGIIARKLFGVLRTGICQTYHREIAIELVQEWDRLYPMDLLGRYGCVQERE